MKHIWRISAALLILAVMVIAAIPVHADMPDPDSEPTAEFDVYRHLIEANDMLYLIYANIPYNTLPDYRVDEAFIWRLFDAAGTTEYGSAVGYPYNDLGYGWNVYSMYFSAAEVTALGITWGTAYPLKLSGNPLAFATPPEYNYTVLAGDYELESDQEGYRELLMGRIFGIANGLELAWNLTEDELLIDEIQGLRYLTLSGEVFFRSAIYGLQGMAPALFQMTVGNATAVDRTWTNQYAENLTTQYSGTWVDTAREAGKALFQTNMDLLSIIIVMVCVVGVVIGNVMTNGDTWAGVIDISAVLVLTCRAGLYGMGFLGLVASICIIYIGSRFFRFGG